MRRPPKYVVLDKPRGQTPLETINAWKEQHPEWKDVPASYAGRLDPMAEGRLLVLLGEECKRQHAYTKLDKEYVVEVALDFSTDTGDVLGLAEYAGKETTQAEVAASLGQVLSSEIGTHSRAYPIFSSKTVKGKPLFLHALEGMLDTIEIPSHDETFYSIRLERVDFVMTSVLQERLKESLRVVPTSDEPSKLLGADFRQVAVRKRWEEVFAGIPECEFIILKLRIVCGSGAYMRTFAERLGIALGTSALALSIRRTRIGSYRKFGPFGVWTRSFA